MGVLVLFFLSYIRVLYNKQVIHSSALFSHMILIMGIGYITPTVKKEMCKHTPRIKTFWGMQFTLTKRFVRIHCSRIKRDLGYISPMKQSGDYKVCLSLSRGNWGAHSLWKRCRHVAREMWATAIHNFYISTCVMGDLGYNAISTYIKIFVVHKSYKILRFGGNTLLIYQKISSIQYFGIKRDLRYKTPA